MRNSALKDKELNDRRRMREMDPISQPVHIVADGTDLRCEKKKRRIKKIETRKLAFLCECESRTMELRTDLRRINLKQMGMT